MIRHLTPTLKGVPRSQVHLCVCTGENFWKPFRETPPPNWALLFHLLLGRDGLRFGSAWLMSVDRVKPSFWFSSADVATWSSLASIIMGSGPIGPISWCAATSTSWVSSPCLRGPTVWFSIYRFTPWESFFSSNLFNFYSLCKLCSFFCELWKETFCKSLLSTLEASTTLGFYASAWAWFALTVAVPPTPSGVAAVCFSFSLGVAPLPPILALSHFP